MTFSTWDKRIHVRPSTFFCDRSIATPSVGDSLTLPIPPYLGQRRVPFDLQAGKFLAKQGDPLRRDDRSAKIQPLQSLDLSHPVLGQQFVAHVRIRQNDGDQPRSLFQQED